MAVQNVVAEPAVGLVALPVAETAAGLVAPPAAEPAAGLVAPPAAEPAAGLVALPVAETAAVLADGQRWTQTATDDLMLAKCKTCPKVSGR